jgi:hypothetical protein
MSLLYASYIHVKIKSCHALDLVLLVVKKFSSSNAHSIIIMHIVYVKYDAQIIK